MAKKAKKKAPAKAATRQAAPAAAKTAPVKKIKVEATSDGYYGEKYRRTGDVFEIDSPKHLGKWMKETDPKRPEKITSSGEALDRERQNTLADRAATRGLAAPIDNPTGAKEVI